MDIIAIEKEYFDSFKKKLEQIASLVPKQPSNNALPIEQEWIEDKELASFLNISPHRLQFLRENGKLSFSTIEKKLFSVSNHRLPQY